MVLYKTLSKQLHSAEYIMPLICNNRRNFESERLRISLTKTPGTRGKRDINSVSRGLINHRRSIGDRRHGECLKSLVFKESSLDHLCGWRFTVLRTVGFPRTRLSFSQQRSFVNRAFSQKLLENCFQLVFTYDWKGDDFQWFWSRWLFF